MFTNQLRWKWFHRKKEFNPHQKYRIPSSRTAPKATGEIEDYIKNTRLLLQARLKSVKPRRKYSNINELKLFLDKHNLLVKPSDKNLGLCILSKGWYKSEVLRQLNNKKFYSKVTLDEHQIKQTVRNNLVTLVKIMKIDPDSDVYQFIFHKRLQRTIPKFYIIPKIHKEVMTGRPIVASANWLTTNLSIWITDELKKELSRCPYVLKDSTSLINYIERNKESLTEGIFITIDVESLYTNMDIEMVIRILNRFIPKRKDITKAVEFVLRNNFFEFNDQYYHQKNGMAMGTNMAVVIANIFLSELLDKQIFTELPIFSKHLKMFRRYIDDCISIWTGPVNVIPTFIKALEFIAKPLKFTYQIDPEKISFLDIELFWYNGNLATKVFQKKLNRYLYIPYTSNHPRGTKSGFIKAELIRYARLCSNEEDFEEIKSSFFYRLQQRKYPNEFIQNVFNTVKYENRKVFLQEKTAVNTEIIALKVHFSPRVSKMRLAHIIQVYKSQIFDKFPGYFKNTRFLQANKAQPNIGSMLIKAKFSF